MYEAVRLGPAFRVGPVVVFIRRQRDGRSADVVRLTSVDPIDFQTLGVVALHGSDETFDLDLVTQIVENYLKAQRDEIAQRVETIWNG